jgi:hypothetical protein
VLLELLLTNLELQQYLTLALSALGLSGFIFGFTPKGWPMLKATWNFLNKNVFYKDIYANIARLDKRIDDIEDVH